MIDRISGDISIIASEGNDVVIVSSGAVSAGMKKLGMKTKPTDIRFKAGCRCCWTEQSNVGI